MTHQELEMLYTKKMLADMQKKSVLSELLAKPKKGRVYGVANRIKEAARLLVYGKAYVFIEDLNTGKTISFRRYGEVAQ